MALFRSSEVIGIAGETLSFALNAAEQTHPREYMGFLRAERASGLGLDREGKVITDVLIVPGTVSNESSARVSTVMKPNAPGSVGSIHSHPSGVLRPSDTDRDSFKRGDVHIIIGKPYGWNDWQAFDSDGDPIELDVLDVDLPDDEFFDFTQEDIDRELQAEDDGGGILSWFR